MSCNKGKVTHVLDYPVAYLNFISYETCGDTKLLAKYGLVTVKFPAIISTSRLQISILDCDSNIPVFDSIGKPVLATNIVVAKPYTIYFCPKFGGYVLKDFVCTNNAKASVDIPTLTEGVEETKGVTKK